jgi:hypothetical protein
MISSVYIYIYTLEGGEVHAIHVKQYRHAPISADSASMIYCGHPKNFKIKEINGS